MKRKIIIIVIAVMLVVGIVIGFVFMAKKMNNDRKRVVDEAFFGNFTPHISETTPAPTESSSSEKTAEQMYLEWQVYNLLTDSIKSDLLRVNPSQIRCSERNESGKYIVFGMYYIGDEPHSITVYYESEGDGIAFNTDDFRLIEVVMDQDKVFPTEGDVR